MPDTNHRIRPIAAFLVAIFTAASLACSLSDQVVSIYKPEPTQPTATETPVQIAAPVSAADQLLLDRAGEWDLFYEERFTDDGGSWLTGQDENDYLSVERTIAEGKYTWETAAYKSTHAYVYPELDPLTDFSLTIDLGLERWVDGGMDGAAGIDFRMADDQNKYSFVISGEYYTLSRMSDGEWITLIDWTVSPAIRAYRTNKIQIIAWGSQFCFLINDEFVTGYEDEGIPGGQIALAIELYEPADRAVFSFDNLVIAAP